MREHLRNNGLLDIAPDLLASHDYGELCRQFYQTACRVTLVETNGESVHTSNGYHPLNYILLLCKCNKEQLKTCKDNTSPPHGLPLSHSLRRAATEGL